MSTVNQFLTNINKKVSSLKREGTKILSPKVNQFLTNINKKVSSLKREGTKILSPKVNQFLTNTNKEISSLKFLTDINRKISSLKRERTKILSRKMEEIVLITGSILLVFFIYSAIAYNSILEKKRIESIDSFLSNNQTILLKNYILNQVKSPYLEYDYIIKDSDTIEKILKKFSIKNDEITFIVKKIKKMNLSNIDT